MCFVFGSWPFRSRIWSVDDYGDDDDDDDDDVVAMWQCGNVGPRMKALEKNHSNFLQRNIGNQ